MTPSVRSRLWASATSFALGFGVGNYGVLQVPRPDQWVWIAVAVVLMLTGAAGVLFADTSRAVSFWAILGVEVFAVFTLVPLLWTFTVATTPEGATARTLLPQDISWSAFDGAISSGTLRSAATTSLLVALVATVVAVALAVPAAYALVRLQVRARRLVYGLVVAALLMPVLALAGPFADQLVSLGAYGSRLALVVPMLVVTLPLATWLCVTVMRDVPWTLLDAVRADGATRPQQLRRFAVPHLGPGVVAAALLVFVAACNDFALGAGLAPDRPSLPLPATLLVASRQVDGSSAVAAAGLLWLLIPLIVLLVLPRRINHLLGRSYR
ncbi:ABC transporter permease subunit [Aeromicrobium endophyticum]|uniref:Carbohydrate ABC transporter permease n=1 Tax=Aeromicrobium endophyticum TaxID=2292704 RepID=A0A371P5T0_9ACTN|nr:ABC transporter permease subunit [Aeromicrobium endophyticum]REK70908.1 carbohydrate ABC transporter permease [Aeromicrobium endophyticum]